MLQILRYNWPLYASTWIGGAAGLVGLARLPLPSPARWLLGSITCSGLGWSAMSLMTAHYVYDLSALSRWDWLSDLFADSTPRAKGRYLNLHAGVDEAGGGVQRAFPAGQHLTADFYDPRSMPEGSIRRAREQDAAVSPTAALRVASHALPFADGSWDAVLLVFAAHELRAPAARTRLFSELRRVLSADGAVVLAEHMRDLPNFLAFGPGVLHWYPGRTWLDAARQAGLTLTAERRLTPFVHALVFRPGVAPPVPGHVPPSAALW